MNQITFSSICSSSSSNKQNHQPKTIKWSQPLYLNSLHSVRKTIQKPISKHYIAPMPPTQPKIYNVNASNFKDIVRELTSMPEFQHPPKRRLKDIAPPPLVLSTIPKPSLRSPKPSPPSSEDGRSTESPDQDFFMSMDFCNPISKPTSPPSSEDIGGVESLLPHVTISTDFSVPIHKPTSPSSSENLGMVNTLPADVIIPTDFCITKPPSPTSSEDVRMVRSVPEFDMSTEFYIEKPPSPPPSSEDGVTMSPLSEFTMSKDVCNLLNETDPTTFTSESDGMDFFGTHEPMDPWGLILSPTSLSWCCLALQSSGTLSSFTQNQFI